MTFALSVLPIILTLGCGMILVATRILPREHWQAIEVLSFRVLIPAVLIRAIATSDLSLWQLGPMLWILVLTLVLAGSLVLALRALCRAERLPNRALTTLFQTTIRWNAFIALAAAELFIGALGTNLIVVAMAVLIPIINIASIVVLAAFGATQTTFRLVAMTVIKNPVVQGCLIGLAINLSGMNIPHPLMQTIDMIARGALGVGLLAVGAGTSLARLRKLSFHIWLGVMLRPMICPAVFLVLAELAALGAIEKFAGVIALSVPAATNGYVITRQMGGDADLYADILTWQTILTMLVLPFLAALLLTS